MNHNTILSIIMLSLFPGLSQGRELALRTVGIEAEGREMKMKVLQPKEADGPVPGILWIHGGGYITGVNYMVLFPWQERSRQAKRRLCEEYERIMSIHTLP